ncbi:MAG: DeoR/GlpR family DNA-binding transcription regulator [Blautia sp.]|nr:DeoR/GlpR family DNA-binding transcription regulator [Blautia sp.]MDY5030305.1 DeoR/GlpR family DNA-binding transcription regulator [Blautia sp.]
MAQKERLEQIEQMIREEKRVTVTDLSDRLGVTPETIRRDLEKLEDKQLLTRTYGGAVLRQGNVPEKVSFQYREKTNVEAKHVIAQLAAGQVPANASIGCDASSTSMEFLNVLKDRSDVLVLTNSAKAIQDLDSYEFRLLSTGGYVNTQSYSMQGGTARNLIQEYYLDQIFMSCKGIGYDGGIFDSHELEIDMKKSMLEQGGKRYLLVDHMKFGNVGFTKLANLRQMDVVITDRKPSVEWMDLFEKNGLQVLYPKED